MDKAELSGFSARTKLIPEGGNQESECDSWEKAIVAQSRDAAVGRLFKGIIHNLNGDIQALSMQAELFAMVFSQAEETMAQALASPTATEARNALLSTRDLLLRRASLLPQMQQAVQSLKEIVRGASGFGESLLNSEKGDHDVNVIVRAEEKFLCADSFFKHRVERRLVLAEALPPVSRHYQQIRFAVAVLLANALEALKKKSEPPWALVIETGRRGAMTEIAMEHNGIGLSPADHDQAFEPFPASGQGVARVELYLARQTAASLGGAISFESLPDRSRFLLSLPTDRIS